MVRLRDTGEERARVHSKTKTNADADDGAAEHECGIALRDYHHDDANLKANRSDRERTPSANMVGEERGGECAEDAKLQPRAHVKCECEPAVPTRHESGTPGQRHQVD